jgi:mevalonate kinase
LIRINHSLLDAIGVGHVALTEVVAASASVGFTSKLTGAGGGGCAITLLDAQPESAVDPEKLKQLSELLL